MIPNNIKEILKKIYKFSLQENKKLYLVGGFLRDYLLGKKEFLDIDFCLNKSSIKFSQKLSKFLKVGFVVLDREHHSTRLVKKAQKGTLTIDFNNWRAQTLKEDLLHRDFTINSLALELKHVFSEREIEKRIIDYLGGIKDIQSRIIKMNHKKIFDEDPLRILRAFSLACVLDFKIEENTLKLIKIKAKKLSEVAGERVRDELFKILETNRSAEYFSLMDKLNVLEVIFPEINSMRNVEQGPYHHLDVWRHSLETQREADILVEKLKSENSEIREYLEQVLSGGRKRESLLKLAALFHDIGKPKALVYRQGKTTFYGHERVAIPMIEEISSRLKLSNIETEAFKKMVLGHLRPGFLADSEELTQRAIFRFFRDMAEEAPSALIVSLADKRATRGPLTTKDSQIRHQKLSLRLIQEYFLKKKEKKPVRLITGDDLIRDFKLEPSPLIGKILREIEELQGIGKIHTKKEALEVVRRLLKNNKRNK